MLVYPIINCVAYKLSWNNPQSLDPSFETPCYWNGGLRSNKVVHLLKYMFIKKTNFFSPSLKDILGYRQENIHSIFNKVQHMLPHSLNEMIKYHLLQLNANSSILHCNISSMLPHQIKTIDCFAVLTQKHHLMYDYTSKDNT